MKINEPIYIMNDRIETYIRYWEEITFFGFTVSSRFDDATQKYQFYLNKEALRNLQHSFRKLLRGRPYKSRNFFSVTFRADEIADSDRIVADQIDRIHRIVDEFVKIPSITDGVRLCVLNAVAEILTMQDMYNVTRVDRRQESPTHEPNEERTEKPPCT